jgi:flavin-dependent dehydrogenase
MDFDVIILGANYAGLAAAGELVGRRVLLLDRKPIGTGQASACATLVETMEALGASDAIAQAHDALYLHVGSRTIEFAAHRHPFCTFDHERFCKHLFAQTDGIFRQEDVRDIRGTEIITNRGRYSAPIIIEALGWRGSRRREPKTPTGYSFGMETPLPITAQGLHFYYAPQRWGRGYAWAFPADSETRFGIGWYAKGGKIDVPFRDFLNDFHLTAAPYQYGGYFPWYMRPVTLEGRYIVGDAAGHCIGLTGEGIRPAIYFAIAAARAAARVLDGDFSADQGLATYSQFAASHNRYFRFLSFLQVTLPRLPGSILAALATQIAVEHRWTGYIDRYARIFDVAALLKNQQAILRPKPAWVAA